MVVLALMRVPVAVAVSVVELVLVRAGTIATGLVVGVGVEAGVVGVGGTVGVGEGVGAGVRSRKCGRWRDII